ncbi:triose-phosphate isomerase [Candidatus Saccharibacteria bacterium]|jgi:triosephosphate isomerase|nr:triose-phosphate isomerase [Candidatus Saccharibacteria bacterium]
MNKKFLIVGNWKMNLTTTQASLLVHRLSENIKIHKNIEVVLAPTMLTLQPISLQIDHRKFKLASQDAYFIDEGAYTGQVSFTMLKNLVKYGIIGHSERRHIFGESLETVTKKVAAAYRNNIIPILCVGETNIERLAGETNQVIHDQVETALANITSEDINSLVIAYEPVWAIGTGSVATPDQASSVAKVIRNDISELYGSEAAGRVRILYGGSVKPDLVSGFLRDPQIDGLLVGGASLNYRQFADIVTGANRVAHNLKLKEDE